MRSCILALLVACLSLLSASADDFCGPSNAKVIKGQRTYLCLVIADLENWNGSTETGDVAYRRFSFRPIVDDFTKMEVQDCEWEGGKGGGGEEGGLAIPASLT